jgi:hypothetical protein
MNPTTTATTLWFVIHGVDNAGGKVPFAYGSFSMLNIGDTGAAAAAVPAGNTFTDDQVLDLVNGVRTGNVFAAINLRDASGNILVLTNEGATPIWNYIPA